MTTQETLKLKLKDVNRGAYWFGIIGRLSVLWGCVSFLAALALFGLSSFDTPVQSDLYPKAIEALTDSFMPLVSGWLFLLGRDAFQAIEALIIEMNEIV